jgi:VRR-NUC domain
VAFALTSPVQRERDEQIQDARMLHILVRPGVCWTAIDHGHTFDMTPGRYGKPRGLIEAQKRKARGCRPGIPDFLFWADGKPYAIERKVEGGRVSGEQQQFQTELRTAGVAVATCWSQRELADTLQGWGLLRPFQ